MENTVLGKKLATSPVGMSQILVPLRQTSVGIILHGSGIAKDCKCQTHVNPNTDQAHKLKDKVIQQKALNDFWASYKKDKSSDTNGEPKTEVQEK